VVSERTIEAKCNLNLRFQRRVIDDISVVLKEVDAGPERTRQGRGSEMTVQSRHTGRHLSTIEDMTVKSGRVEKVPLDGRIIISTIRVNDGAR
jgi:hypothetical protein